MIEHGNFRCNILAHSINPVGLEAITFEATSERFLHSEVLRHRWSCNASSSRAIPYKRMKEWTLADPAMPLHFGTNRAGMQAGAECDNPDLAKEKIKRFLLKAIDFADDLVEDQNLHKEIVNRYLEPWGWINVVMTMGRPQFMNFLKLRMDGHAHPNIQRLAVNMARLYRKSVPHKLAEGQWHLPYITRDEWVQASIDEYADPENPEFPWGDLLIWSVARCAWVSYKTVDGKVATFEHAKRRHDECLIYKHLSTAEHQLRARSDDGRNGGCVPGYDCYRHMIPGERCDDFDYEELLDDQYKDVDYIVL